MKPRIGKFTETESRVVVTGSEGTREGELCLMGREFQFGQEDGKLLKVDGGDGCTKCECTSH